MQIDAIEYSRKLRREIDLNEERFDELMKEESSEDNYLAMSKNLAERTGLLLAMKILTDMMMKKGEHNV